MGCNVMVGLSAGRRVAGGDCVWLRPVRPHPELECTLYAPATSSAQGGQDAAGCMLIFLLMQYCLVNNLTQAVDARPDITMHRLSLSMTVKKLPKISIGIIAIMAAPVTQTFPTLVGHIILSSRELEGTSDAGDFPTK